MLNLRPILLANGVFLSFLGVIMLIPAAVDLYLDNEDALAFLESCVVTTFVGVSLFLTNRGYKKRLNIRETFLLTASLWFVLPLFASMPMYLASKDVTWADAIFESVSGLTTTGATVLTNLDNAPPGILLWRSLLHWIGGIGFIAFGVIVLPMLRIGGMQLFRTESSDKSEKILPHAGQMAKVIGGLYAFFTVLCAMLLWSAGMSGFDAINHAMSTVSTGGFSTKDASIAAFSDLRLVEPILIIFMILGGLPFLLFFQYIRGRRSALVNDWQVRWFIAICIGATGIMTLWTALTDVYDWGDALRHASFNMVSVLSTTGFATQAYDQWGNFAITFVFLICVLGGCTGSTTGGIKIFRLQVLFEAAKIQVQQLLQPHGIFKVQYNNKPLEHFVTSAVIAYIVFFGVCFLVFAAALSLFGLDYLTSMSGAAAVLANLGPGLGEIIGPTGNYQILPDGAKWLLCFGMILGRLELFTILVIISPFYWRE